MYKINEKYFDSVDNEEKAYWLGFWWCDGYVGRRDRYVNKKRKTEYNFKCSLKDEDQAHLEKFTRCLESSHPIHIYKNSNGYKEEGADDTYEARLFITNLHMGNILQDKYGLVPHRKDCRKLIDNIPAELVRHFIRGVLDADGSFSWYYTSDRGYTVLKCSVRFTTYTMLIKFIEQHLYDHNIITSNNHRSYQRHKDGDGNCRTLTLSGRIQAMQVLNYLYGNATIYLDKKFIKYQEMLKVCV